MAYLKGKGAPGRDTKGAIGDIYTDTTTNKKYKCVFAYALGDTYDCSWKLLKNTSSNSIEDQHNNSGPDDDVQTETNSEQDTNRKEKRRK